MAKWRLSQSCDVQKRTVFWSSVRMRYLALAQSLQAIHIYVYHEDSCDDGGNNVRRSKALSEDLKRTKTGVSVWLSFSSAKKNITFLNIVVKFTVHVKVCAGVMLFPLEVKILQANMRIVHGWLPHSMFFLLIKRSQWQQRESEMKRCAMCPMCIC